MEHLDLQSLQEAGLFPHQAEFIMDFLSPDSPPYHQLVAPTGSGKSILIPVLASHLIAEHRAVRILALTDFKALQMALSSILQKHVEGISVRAINRQVFRELEASVGVGCSPWDRPIVAVMTLDFAKQRDIADSLTAVVWDLVVVDEAHLLAGERKAWLDQLVESGVVRRLLLIRSTADADSVLLPGLKTTKWSRDVVGWNGNPLFKPRERRVVLYERGPDEIEFLQSLQETLQKELIEGPFANLQRRVLLRVASSSLYAIEQSLLRLCSDLARGTRLAIFDDDGERELDVQDAETSQGIPAERINGSSSWTDPGSALGKITKLIEQLDQISSDAKLQALLTLMEQICTGERTCHVCIFSSFATTVSYLCSSLRDAGIGAYQFTGPMSHEERDRVYHQFADTGDVLVASSAAITGLDLADMDVGINYDLPSNRLEVERRWGLLDRPRRTSPSIMYAFRDISGVLSLEVEALQLHGFEESQ
jgi:superfamily II DNA or RNA helicase